MPNVISKSLHAQSRAEEYSRCTAQHPDGTFCNALSIEDAPFPICVEHAAQVLRHLAGYIRDFNKDPLLRMLAYDFTKSDQVTERAMQAWRERPEETVYYLRVGKLIKIGYTTNLKNRLRSYPPDTKVLATEPGGANLENRRHGEFVAHLRHGKEWFAPAPELIEHINRLRKARKAPPIKAA